MSKLTNGEQAALERALALAHRHVWTALQLFDARDDYDTADDLRHICNGLAHLLDVELSKSVKLRTRPHNRA